jgi:hypothetical protein
MLLRFGYNTLPDSHLPFDMIKGKYVGGRLGMNEWGLYIMKILPSSPFKCTCGIILTVFDYKSLQRNASHKCRRERAHLITPGSVLCILRGGIHRYIKKRQAEFKARNPHSVPDFQIMGLEWGRAEVLTLSKKKSPTSIFISTE